MPIFSLISIVFLGRSIGFDFLKISYMIGCCKLVRYAYSFKGEVRVQRMITVWGVVLEGRRDHPCMGAGVLLPKNV